MNNFLAYELRENVQNYAFYFERILSNFLKNVSSLHLTKTSSFRLSFQKFKKIQPNTLIYKAILIKICMNAYIINTQIFIV